MCYIRGWGVSKTVVCLILSMFILKLHLERYAFYVSYQNKRQSFNFDQTSTRYCLQMQLQNKHRQYEAHDRLRYTPASFNFDQSSPRYCFQMQLQNKHRQYEAHDRLRYTPAPYIPHIYSFKTKSMHFMSYNFLNDPLSLFQFRSNFTKVLLLDVASK